MRNKWGIWVTVNKGIERAGEENSSMHCTCLDAPPFRDVVDTSAKHRIKSHNPTLRFCNRDKESMEA